MTPTSAESIRIEVQGELTIIMLLDIDDEVFSYASFDIAQLDQLIATLVRKRLTLGAAPPRQPHAAGHA